MKIFSEEIKALLAAWDPARAKALIWEMTLAAWKERGPDAALRAGAAEIAGVVEQRLSLARTPAEQLALTNLLYDLSQGMGDRAEALAIAQRAEKLSRQLPGTGERIAAVFQLAKAWLYVDDASESVRWSKEGMRLGIEQEQAGHGDDRLARLLADESTRLAVRMTPIGGMEEDVDRFMEMTLSRWQAIDDTAARTDAMGLLAEARMIQGRFADCVQLSKTALDMAGFPEKTEGITYALWCGGRAYSRLGDPQTGIIWAERSVQLCQAMGNAVGAFEARMARASCLCLAGRQQEGLQAVEEALREVESLHFDAVTQWLKLERAWIRLKMGLATPTEELQEMADTYLHMGYQVFAAETLYALACARRRAGLDCQPALGKACGFFDRFRMTGYLACARKGELLL